MGDTARIGSGGKREMDGVTVRHSERRRVGETSCTRSFADDHGVAGVTDGRRCWARSGTFREGESLIELFVRCSHLCRPGYRHDQDLKRLEMMDDGTPAFLATLALYFEFFDGGAYNDGATQCLFLRAFSHRLERDPEVANGERKGLEGGRRSKPSIDRRRNSYRRVDKLSRRREEDGKMRRALEGRKIGERDVGCMSEHVLPRR